MLKNLFRIISSYKFSLITIVFFELLYLIKGYKGNRFDFMSNNIPCPYYFLYKIKKTLKNNNFYRFLDLGCGSGRHCELLIKHGYQVYGCDVSSLAIKITIERIRNLNLKGKFEVSNFNSLPYENEFFDVIIA